MIRRIRCSAKASNIGSKAFDGTSCSWSRRLKRNGSNSAALGAARCGHRTLYWHKIQLATPAEGAQVAQMPDQGDFGLSALPATIRSGERVLIRQVRPEDMALYPDFLRDVSAEDLRL